MYHFKLGEKLGFCFYIFTDSPPWLKSVSCPPPAPHLLPWGVLSWWLTMLDQAGACRECTLDGQVCPLGTCLELDKKCWGGDLLLRLGGWIQVRGVVCLPLPLARWHAVGCSGPPGVPRLQRLIHPHPSSLMAGRHGDGWGLEEWRQVEGGGKWEGPCLC